MATYLDYNATASLNVGVPPLGAPEGMKPSTVNDAMRSMMSAIRDLGDQSLGGSGHHGGTSTGTGLAYVIDIVPAVGSLSPGRFFTFIAHTSNTGGATLTITGFPAKAMRKDGLPLTAGDIVSGGTYLVEDIGTIFALLNPHVTLPALGTAALRNVGLGASDVPANSNLGSAAYRAVGVASGNVVEVVDGSGNLNAGVNAPNKDLSNLFTAGKSRTIHAAVAFTGSTGVAVGSFNSATVTRNSIGLYTVTFPTLSGVYQVLVTLDVAVSANGFNASVVSGSRSSTSVQISTMQGNSSVTAFDPDRVTVTIHPIG